MRKLDNGSPRHATGIGGSAVANERLPYRRVDPIGSNQQIRLDTLSVFEVGLDAVLMLFDGHAAVIEVNGAGRQRRGNDGLQPRPHDIQHGLSELLRQRHRLRDNHLSAAALHREPFNFAAAQFQSLDNLWLNGSEAVQSIGRQGQTRANGP